LQVLVYLSPYPDPLDIDTTGPNVGSDQNPAIENEKNYLCDSSSYLVAPR
jgi:hypothetical protein